MENTESRRRNDDTIRILHEFREIIAEAQRHGLPSLFEERKNEGKFRAEIGSVTIESTICVRDAINQLKNAGILSDDISRLSGLFTEAIETVAPTRNFSEFSTDAIASVAHTFNDRKFSAQSGR